MAYLRGGSTRGLVLVGKLYDNASFEGKVKEDGTPTKGGQFIDFEIARFVDANDKQVNDNQPKQFQPSLRNTKSKTRENSFDRGVAYNEDELASFIAAAGPNVENILNHNTGEQVGKLIVLQADVIPTKVDGQSYLRVNHKSAAPVTDIALPENIREAQFEGIQNDIAGLQAEKQSKVEEGKAPEAAAAVDKPAEKDAVPNF
ncbi:hypothetical protein [Rhodococcus sp. OAS809]|uniref:hypothetical protein n=1 Tax=Rhodococcus sp. OAS809 TaxID=2663874 RepID=UPI00178B0998